MEIVDKRRVIESDDCVPPKKLDSPIKGFAFFKEHAASGLAFTIQELAAETGWDEASIKTYRSKQWKDLLEVDQGGLLRVRPEFLRLTQSEFLDHITQKRPLFARYKRTAYPALLVFEFLIPLTRESQLRAALDQLFFKDTIRQRLAEIGAAKLEPLLARDPGETESTYLDRAVRFANKFYGYSIGHVAGRFRAAAELLARTDAAAFVADGGRYLIDETTAVVRFVLPLQATSKSFEDSLFVPKDLDEDDDDIPSQSLKDEVHSLRTMFFLLFVEAVVRTIKGEDEIWLLERGVRDRLYVWSRDE
jgi:hypothetical protein